MGQAGRKEEGKTKQPANNRWERNPDVPASCVVSRSIDVEVKEAATIPVE